MSTRNFVPRANGEGSIGTEAKQWENGYFENVWVSGEKAGTLSSIIAANPVYYARESLMMPGKTTITLPSVMNINIGGQGYIHSGTTVLNLDDPAAWDSSTYATAVNRKGKDFYVYACQPASGKAPVFKLSANSTVPTGYTASNSRKIGGFHCLCADVGTISGHALSGYVTGNILPLSVWDLKHRPVASPEGMVWIEGIGRWVDIYLASWDGSALASEFGATIADGTSSPAFHGEKFAEYLGLTGKSLITRDEFIVAAKGSNELTSINGSADPGTTGGHKDTANRRMISNYGLEDCCGALWQWGKDCYEFYPGATWNPTTNQYFAGYAWQESSVYHAGTDAQKHGSCNGLLRRVLLGGRWDNGASCGSRAAFCGDFSAGGGYAAIGARGASEPLSAA